MSKFGTGILVAVLTGGLAAALGQATGADAAAARPAVTAVSPAVGRITAGTLVTLHGTGVGAATTVRFGTARATAIKRLSATGIVAVAPAHAAGRVNVQVVTASGTSVAADANRYTFRAAPAVVTGAIDRTYPADVHPRVISCGSTTNCAGVGGTTDDGDHTHEYVTNYNGKAWSAGRALVKTFDSVKCYPTGTCIAHGRPEGQPTARRTYIYDGKTWTDFSSTVPTSCETFASRYFCLGGTTRNPVVYDHGRAGKALTVVTKTYPTDFVTDAVCPSTSTCYVLTYDLRVARYTTGSGWGSLIALRNFNESTGANEDTAGPTLACPNTTSCVVAGPGSRVSYLHSGLWSFAQPLAPGLLLHDGGVSCATIDYCVGNATTRTASGQYEFRRVAFAGTASSNVLLETEKFDAYLPEALSCPVVGTCVTVGQHDRYGVLTS